MLPVPLHPWFARRTRQYRWGKPHVFHCKSGGSARQFARETGAAFAVSEEAVRNDDAAADGDPDGGGGAVASESVTPTDEWCLEDRFQSEGRRRHGSHSCEAG